MSVEVTIPDIGDAEDVEVIEICVAAGDTVAENDALIVIESDKASMEVPAPRAGDVAEVIVALGDRVNAGDAILRLDAADGGSPAAVAEQVPAAAPPPQAERAAPTATDQASAAETQSAMPPGPAAAAATGAAAEDAGARRVYAGPAVRRLARELGVALTAVAGSGAGGRILKDDVKAFVKANLGPRPGLTPLPSAPTPDYARFGAIERVPLSRIRRRGAANLQAAWQQVVHVTAHDEADATDLEAFRRDLAGEAEAAGVKLTLLPFVMKACVHVLHAHPQFNASLDPGCETLIHKRYYHIGMAVDTADGLVVPVLRDADAFGVLELAAQTARLAEAARAGRLKPAELQGGSFTISSLGAIGGTGFTPVVNAPEVAILGVARLQTRPHWDGAAFVPRRMLPLSLSYDHRAINGAEAGRFMAALTATLADIRRLVL